MIDLTTNPATSAGWHTNFYTSTCATAFDTYIRDLDISRGRHVRRGLHHRGLPRQHRVRHRLSRFAGQTNAAHLTPTWINYTGGDTSYAVEIHDGVAYIGGHMRWVNNPFAGDSAGAGAVPREGIDGPRRRQRAAVLLESWSERGVGLFDYPRHRRRPLGRQRHADVGG